MGGRFAPAAAAQAIREIGICCSIMCQLASAGLYYYVILCVFQNLKIEVVELKKSVLVCDAMQQAVKFFLKATTCNYVVVQL